MLIGAHRFLFSQLANDRHGTTLYDSSGTGLCPFTIHVITTHPGGNPKQTYATGVEIQIYNLTVAFHANETVQVFSVYINIET